MRPPDEVKKGLEYCKPIWKGDHWKNCDEKCPYSAEMSWCKTILNQDTIALIQQLEQREWDLFDLLSSAWHGKQYYFKQEDGSVYSRESCQYLTFDQAIDEFAHSLTVVPGNNEFQYETGFVKGFEAAYPKWISVKERLPEICELVLVIASGKPKENVKLIDAVIIASYWGDEGWIAEEFDGWGKLNVTHWMPLPSTEGLNDT